MPKVRPIDAGILDELAGENEALRRALHDAVTDRDGYHDGWRDCREAAARKAETSLADDGWATCGKVADAIRALVPEPRHTVMKEKPDA